MANCLPLSGGDAGGNIFNHEFTDVCQDDLGVQNDPALGKAERSTEEQLDRNRVAMAPQKLLRSVSLKLRMLRQRFGVEEQNSTVTRVDGERSENQVRQEESILGSLFRLTRGEGTVRAESEEQQEKDRWGVSGCLGFYGRKARPPDEMDEATQNDEVIVRYEWNGSRGGGAEAEVTEEVEMWTCKLRKDMDLLSVDSVSREAVKGPWREREDELDEEERGSKQCGCFCAGGAAETLKGWGTRGVKEKRKMMHNNSEDESRTGTLKAEIPGLPDDIVEMCLARTPFTTLTRARSVCKKWRTITTSPQFFHMRERAASSRPWLFLFGLYKDGVCMGQIHALDPTFNRWHTIRANLLSGRFLFSVVAADSSIYIIGGCSSSQNRPGRPDKSSLKTHKGVLVYNPLTSSWKKACSMGAARAMPIVGVFEIRGGRHVRGTSGRSSSSFRDYFFGDSLDNGLEGGPGVVNTEDANRSKSARGWCSLGRIGEISTSGETHRSQEIREMERDRKPSFRFGLCGPEDCSAQMHTDNFAWERPVKESRSYGLIVVGGQGLWNEPLDSGELYDPIANRWKEIARLPADHGVVCAGVICNGFFYVYSETDKLAAYDFEQNSWTNIQVSNIPARLHEYIPKLVSCRGRLFMLGVAWGNREREGGIGSEKAIRMLWEFDFGSRAWLEVCKHPDAPLDWNAVFVSEGDQIFGVEMFKIFGQVLDFVTVCDVSVPKVKWNRVSRICMANDMDVSSCITKTAAVVQL